MRQRRAQMCGHVVGPFIVVGITAGIFGRDLFVSPVVREDVTTWDVRLPEGAWRDLWTGNPCSGGQTVTIDAPLDRIPVFVREGAAVPVRLPDGAKLGDPVSFGVEATGTLAFD